MCPSNILQGAIQSMSGDIPFREERRCNISVSEFEQGHKMSKPPDSDSAEQDAKLCPGGSKSKPGARNVLPPISSMTSCKSLHVRFAVVKAACIHVKNEVKSEIHPSICNVARSPSLIAKESSQPRGAHAETANHLVVVLISPRRSTERCFRTYWRPTKFEPRAAPLDGM